MPRKERGKKRKASAWMLHINRKTHSRKPRVLVKAPRGQPPLIMVSSQYSPARGRAVVRALRAGHYTDTAAALVGVTKDVVEKWLRTGARILDSSVDQDLSTLTEEDRLLAQFTLDVQKGMAKMEKENLNFVKAARPMWWQSAAWLLERRFPGKWGKQNRAPTGTDVKPRSLIDAKILIAHPDGLKAVGAVFRTLLDAGNEDQRLGPGEDGASGMGQVREPEDMETDEALGLDERLPATGGGGNGQTPAHRDPPSARQKRDDE